MATFSEHINQAKSNLSFLGNITTIEGSWDWQVTVSFYVAVHLANAHLAQKANLHYRTHADVDNALNFAQIMSPYRFNEQNYLAYRKLQNFSRRSRYLVNDNLSDKSKKAKFTHSIHLSKALTHLNTLMDFIKEEYAITFEIIEINCVELKNKELEFFQSKV